MTNYLIQIKGASNTYNVCTGVCFVEAKNQTEAKEIAAGLKTQGCYSLFRDQWIEAVPVSRAPQYAIEDAENNCAIVDTTCNACGKPLGKMPVWRARNAYCGCRSLADAEA